MPTRYLLVGGAGFIGSNLAYNLISRGIDVRILDTKPVAVAGELADITDYVEGDISDAEKVAKSLQGVDVLFHLACTTLPQSSNENIRYDIESNLLPTIDLLHACVEQGVKKVVFISSGGTIYGVPNETPIPEDHPTNPTCSYGITKLAIEKYLYLFHHLFQLDYTVLRLSNPYGPHQDPLKAQGIVSVFIGKYLANQPIEIWGDGQVVRDYIFIDEAVTALTLAAEAAGPAVYNVSSGKGVSLNQMIKFIEEALGIKLDVHYMPARKVDVPINVLDNRKILRHLGWKPKPDMEAGIKATWRWLIDRGNES